MGRIVTNRDTFQLDPRPDFPDDVVMDPVLENAEEELEKRGFWDKIAGASEPIKLSQLVVNLPLQSGDYDYMVMGRQLADAIERAASNHPALTAAKAAAAELLDLAFGGAHDTIRDVNWGGIEGVTKSGSGRVSGVFFLDMGEYVVVLKPAPRDNLGNEAFSLAMARDLGLHTPDFNVIDVSTIDREALRGLGQGGQLLDSYLGGVEHVLMMTMVKGFTLEDMKGRPGQAEGVFKGEHGARVLREVGTLAAFDALTGNTDRFPSGGMGGNPGNLMFDMAGHVAVIDQVTVLGMDSWGAHSRLGYIMESAATGNPDSQNHPAYEISNMILNETGYDIGSQGRQHIHEGMRDGVRKFAEIHRENLERLKASVEATGAVADVNPEAIEWALQKEHASEFAAQIAAQG